MAHILPMHNEALAGDTLYSVSLNYQWRRLVAEAIESYFDRLYPERNSDDDQLTLYNQVSELLIDLYNNEVIPPMATSAARFIRTADQFVPANTEYAIEYIPPPVPQNVSQYDTGGFATIANIIKVPADGIYHIDIMQQMFTTAGATIFLRLYRNSVLLLQDAHIAQVDSIWQISSDFKLNANDNLQARAFGSAALTVTSTTINSFFNIHKIN